MTDRQIRPVNRRLFLGLALALGLASFARAADPKVFEQKDDPENLKALFQRVYDTLNVEKDPAAALDMIRQMVPDERRLKAALRDDIPADSLKILLKLHVNVAKALDSKKFDPLKLAPSKGTELRIFSATTEEMIKNEKGSVTYSQFPNGALRTAERALPPGKRYYVVQYHEPGQARSTREYELIYWDGEQWSMLFEVWAILPEYATK